jgi:hypothetical protein
MRRYNFGCLQKRFRQKCVFDFTPKNLVLCTSYICKFDQNHNDAFLGKSFFGVIKDSP